MSAAPTTISSTIGSADWPWRGDGNVVAKTSRRNSGYLVVLSCCRALGLICLRESGGRWRRIEFAFGTRGDVAGLSWIAAEEDEKGVVVELARLGDWGAGGRVTPTLLKYEWSMQQASIDSKSAHSSSSGRESDVRMASVP